MGAPRRRSRRWFIYELYGRADARGQGVAAYQTLIAAIKLGARAYLYGDEAAEKNITQTKSPRWLGGRCRRQPSSAKPSRMSAELFSRRHLLGIEGLSRPEIENLLDLADAAVDVSRAVEKKSATLRGRTLINLFFEASTRTQSSFELAGKRLGADVMNMSRRQLQREKGRDADRHRDHAQRDAARHHRRAPSSRRRRASAGPQGRLLRRQRRRRRARAPDAGAARRADHPPQLRPHRGADGRDLRRHPAFARGALQHHLL